MKPLHPATLAATAGIAAALVTPGAAFTPMAEAWCTDRASLVRQLETRLGAVRRGQGIRDPDSVLELWADAQGEWTLVLSYADGRACVVSMGEAWEMAPLPDPA